jgi:hypothetical protein
MKTGENAEHSHDLKLTISFVAASVPEAMEESRDPPTALVAAFVAADWTPPADPDRALCRGDGDGRDRPGRRGTGVPFGIC